MGLPSESLPLAQQHLSQSTITKVGPFLKRLTDAPVARAGFDDWLEYWDEQDEIGTMKLILDIPDKLVPAVVRILRARQFPDDDGMTDVIIMRDLKLEVLDYVDATNIVETLSSKIEEGIT